MRRLTSGLLPALLWIASAGPDFARDHKLPAGEASDANVSLTATALDSAELKQIFGTDFDGNYAVIEVTVAPRTKTPVEIHLDDFLLRSDSSGGHSTPFLPGQIAGSGALVVRQPDQPHSKGGLSAGLGGIFMGGNAMGPGEAPEGKAEIKNSDKRDPMLDTLKRKVLAEKTIEEPASGLLFFPLEKEKAKNLTLIYTAPSAKLRVRFK